MGDLVVPVEHPTRVCDACGGVDDHPRHTYGGHGSGRFQSARPEAVAAVLGNTALSDEEKALHVADLTDLSSLALHYDCCRSMGCPTGTCDVLTTGVEEQRGGELRGHIGGFSPFTIPAEEG
jgi:hypothetical protein